MFSKLKFSFSASKKPESADNEDVRIRNRLSKPPTNTSSLNLSCLSLGQPAARSSTLFPLSTSTEKLEEHPPLEPEGEPRELLKARLFGPESEESQITSETEKKAWKGAAFVVTDIETQHSTQKSPSPTPRSPITSPLSTILNASRLSLVSSKEYKDAKESTPPKTHTLPENPSRENLTSPIPIRRKSLSKPGVATRKKDDRWGPSPISEEGTDANRDYYYNPVYPKEASRSELEALNLETTPMKPTPPPLIRTETPKDLAFLGGLKLGSLQITNGRASPAPSDLSRRIKARSTPNLRTASSEYGDSDHEDGDLDMQTTRTQELQPRPGLPEVPPRFNSQTPRYKSPLRIDSNDSVPTVETNSRDVSLSLIVPKRADEGVIPNTSPDRSTFMAEEYMAELPASPFAIQVRPSSSESMLMTTTKTNEYDDDLFEDESVAQSDSDDVDNSTVDTFYSSNDVTAMPDKQDTSPQKTRPAYTLADSGYGSIASLRTGRGKLQESAEETRGTTEPDKAHETSPNEPKIPKKRQDRRPGPRPIRASILKHAGATSTSLPLFENLHHSSTTVATTMSSQSAPPKQQPKKLTKLRILSRTSPKEISVQGNHEIDNAVIPPIPAEMDANLAIRAQQVPELDHTYESRQHTAESPEDSHVDPVEIRFPSPNASTRELNNAALSPPPPPAHRGRFRRLSKSDKRVNVRRESHDMSEADALAIIQDFGTVGHSLSGNPYDIARTNLQQSPRKDIESARKVNPHNITSAAKRPKSLGGMDAETAAELARLRSRSIHERDAFSVAEKRALFNDRGGVPGSNLRPLSFTVHTPPLPALPGGFDTSQRQSWAPQTSRPQPQQRRSWIPERDEWPHSQNGNAQPIHAQPMQNQWDAPHSDYDQGEEVDWADYHMDYHQPDNQRRHSWRSDDAQVDYDPRQSWNPYHEERDFSQQYEEDSHYRNGGYSSYRQADPYQQDQWNQHDEETDVPPPPPPHSPRPMSLAPSEDGNSWTAQRHSWQETRPIDCNAARYGDNSLPYEEESLYPEIPLRNHPARHAYHSSYTEPSYHHNQFPGHQQFQSQDSYDSYGGASRGRPQSRPHSQANSQAHSRPHSQANSQAHSRPHSQVNSRPHSRPHSQANSHRGSYAGSLAEELHPPHDRPRVSPSPQFGRYSGGLNYGYEHGSGFGGSAGTRSVSGVAKASRKGKELSEGFGVDLSDVPIIAGLKRL
jgi:hypothetical protein